MTPFDRSHTSSYSSSIVTMAVYCTVFEKKLDIGRKNANFSYPLVFNLHDPLEPVLAVINFTWGIVFHGGETYRIMV